MWHQEMAFRQQLMLVHMLQGRVAALKQARPYHFDIDLENNIVMRAVPLLSLVQGLFTMLWN